jgi:NADPH-dependent ferric siderophore reductase
MNSAPLDRHQITRVRRETRLRTLRVGQVERLTPNMQRIRFASPDLHDFSSLAPDDHIKLILPSPDGGTVMRDYTPRAFDPAEGQLTIDFALHQAGPATAWALQAEVGDTLGIGGPRGSNVVADDFDWYLLIGDETALPAIGRRLEELRPGVPVTTLVITESPADRQPIATQAHWTPLWIARDGLPLDDGALLRHGLADIALPPGDGYVWIAAEARAARTLRAYMADVRHHPKIWMKAAGYWSSGEAGAHETIGD